MDPADVVASLLGVAVAGGVGYGFVRLIMFAYRRIGRRDGGGTVRELEDLRARVDELEASRVTELEERMDFAERLLARAQEPAHLRGRSES